MTSRRELLGYRQKPLRGQFPRQRDEQTGTVAQPFCQRPDRIDRPPDVFSLYVLPYVPRRAHGGSAAAQDFRDEQRNRRDGRHDSDIVAVVSKRHDLGERPSTDGRVIRPGEVRPKEQNFHRWMSLMRTVRYTEGGSKLTAAGPRRHPVPMPASAGSQLKIYSRRRTRNPDPAGRSPAERNVMFPGSAASSHEAR